MGRAEIYAPSGQRLLAYLIDGWLLSIPASAVATLVLIGPMVRQVATTRTFGYSLPVAKLFEVDVFIAATLTIYLIAAWTIFGQTMGMRLCQLRVAPAGGEGRISLSAAAKRSLIFCIPPLVSVLPAIGGLVSVLALAGFGAALFDPKRRGVHDRMANTVVLCSKPWSSPRLIVGFVGIGVLWMALGALLSILVVASALRYR